MIVLKFSENNLAEALSNTYTSPTLVQSKNHFKYLKKYLGEDGINAKTIVIEESYVSKDFLQDYTSYYALCFQNYPKVCKRVHFFLNEFNDSYFQSIIVGDQIKNEDFWDAYLGFIVVKPIPLTIIGYTVLKTYVNGSEFESRNFWGLRQYSIHIFGKEVKIDSLAFQEQDSVLAACATTAIWTMLNKAATDFYTTLKSPSQITKDADNVSPGGGRLFPNKGLNLLQICHAIVNSGLVSEIKQPDFHLYDEAGKVTDSFISNSYLKKILNAYSPIGIPIILVIQVPCGGQHGLHAIVVTGFKQSAPKHIPPQDQISFLSENIEKIYAHDDQWGPFVRINFEEEINLITPWTDETTDKAPTRLVNIVVPVYPKIRISYEDIEVLVLGLDAILTFFFNENIISDLIWDIRIDFSENFKKQIAMSSLDEGDKFSFVSKSLPKYLWVVSCYITEFKIIEFIFDATDVSNGMIGNSIICYLPSDIKKILSDFLIENRELLHPLVMHKANVDYYNFLIENLN